jgi:hypothetical protein
MAGKVRFVMRMRRRSLVKVSELSVPPHGFDHP